MDSIAVLLSTYNGADYIERQLKSIFEQTYQNIKVYIRDDGSQEAFVLQLKELQNKYPFVLYTGENMGFLKSFMTLLQMVDDADLYAFADQDDEWLPEKLSVAQEWFSHKKNSEIPMLFHSAYELVDEGGKRKGVFSFENKGYDFRRTITENHYSGFAMVVNKTMREYMLRGDIKEIGYHDWWAAMIAHGLGEGYFDSKIMAKHFSHGDNVTTFNLKTRFGWLFDTLKRESEIRKRAKEFERCFGDTLSDGDKEQLQLFTVSGYHIKSVAEKVFSKKRWRPNLVSEFVMRFLMLIGKI